MSISHIPTITQTIRYKYQLYCITPTVTFVTYPPKKVGQKGDGHSIGRLFVPGRAPSAPWRIVPWRASSRRMWSWHRPWPTCRRRGKHKRSRTAEDDVWLATFFRWIIGSLDLIDDIDGGCQLVNGWFFIWRSHVKPIKFTVTIPILQKHPKTKRHCYGLWLPPVMVRAHTCEAMMSENATEKGSCHPAPINRQCHGAFQKKLT